MSKVNFTPNEDRILVEAAAAERVTGLAVQPHEQLWLFSFRDEAQRCVLPCELGVLMRHNPVAVARGRRWLACAGAGAGAPV